MVEASSNELELGDDGAGPGAVRDLGESLEVGIGIHGKKKKLSGRLTRELTNSGRLKLNYSGFIAQIPFATTTPTSKTHTQNKPSAGCLL